MEQIGEKDRVIELLCEKFAADELTEQEFESLVDRVHGAVAGGELEKVLADLPDAGAGSEKELLAAPDNAATRVERVGASEVGDGLGLSGSRSARRTASSDPLPGLEQTNVLAVFGGTTRKGRWRPARCTRAVALFGGIALDLREAVLPPGITEITIVTAWGGVDVTVPPNLHVVISGTAVFGGFDQSVDGGAAPPATPDAPALHIRGVAFMGGVDISARYPGESPREARKRKRLERKLARLRGSGRN